MNLSFKVSLRFKDSDPVCISTLVPTHLIYVVSGFDRVIIALDLRACKYFTNNFNERILMVSDVKVFLHKISNTLGEIIDMNIILNF
jgi:hypothetical protein